MAAYTLRALDMMIISEKARPEVMRTSLASILFSVALAVACGDTSNPGNDSSGGGAGTSHGGSMSGSAPLGGAASGSAGTPSSAGDGKGGNQTAGSGTTAGQGGAGGSAGTLGIAGNAGSAGSGGNADGCTRALLETTVDAYFKALAAHSPATLPLSENVKFTENGKVSKLGDEGLWKTAGALKYAHSALDTELCMAASQAVVPDGASDVPIALRLRLQNQKLSEIETIVARANDYPAVDANPAALAASDDVVKWEQTVPMDQRAKREELTGWMEKYFERFPAGVCNTSSECMRIENGGGSFTCSAGASCAAGPGSGQPVLNSRLVMADVETGIGVGFTIFTGGYIDMHMFKMHGAEVHVVSAILANGASSGWD
jgi:hypothetical protein